MTEEGLRLDKWLWFARFFKSRSLATGACRSGHIRINDILTKKPSQQIVIGDILTLTSKTSDGPEVKTIRICALGARRGPAPEAQALYDDLTPIAIAPNAATRWAERVAPRDAGAGRPTKRERRILDRWRDT